MLIASSSKKVVRYGRPALEIEFDQQALTASLCCRYVPVVVRLCGIPFQQHVVLTVTFERTQKMKDGVPLEDYDAHPKSLFLIHKNIPGYCEYRAILLARPHDEETGTIRIRMESSTSTVLSEAVFRLDSRKREPVASTMKTSSFCALRLLPRIRTDEERDALRGLYPPSGSIQELSDATGVAPLEGDRVQTPTLFPLEIVTPPSENTSAGPVIRENKSTALLSDTLSEEN